MNPEFFIAVYTNQIKKYCDKEFFDNLFNSDDINNAIVEIVDNSIDESYCNRLESITGKKISYLKINRNDRRSLFIRNVTESVNYLRNLFLQTNCKYFITLESDVKPPKNWLNLFKKVIDEADIIGGIYYSGFHPQYLFEKKDILEYHPCILSGCTLYKREIIEKFKFRYELNNLNAFPDSWMSYDARHSGYRLRNYSSIVCKHLTKKGSDSRGLEDLK